MAGLLIDLDVKFEGSGIAGAIGGQAAMLSKVVAAVEKLSGGPDQLLDLEGALGALPKPPGLDGIAKLSGGFSATIGTIPTDFGSLLAPLLAPLEKLTPDALGKASFGVSIQGIGLLRAVLELASQEILSGAEPFPLSAEAWSKQPMPSQAMDVAALRERLATVETAIAAFGPKLDALKLLELLQRAAPGQLAFGKWPTIPVIGEVTEVVETAVRWRAQTPAQLTINLRQDLERIARLIATPRDAVALPLINQANTAASAAEIVPSTLDSLEPQLASLRRKVLESGAQASPFELRELELAVVELERIAQALRLEDSPLAHVEHLHKRLELQLARVVRTLFPAWDPSFITNAVARLLAKIPAANPDPLAGLVTELEKFDTSFLTKPMSAVRDKVQAAVDEVTGAMQTVESSVRGALDPVARALDDARDAAKLDQIHAALVELPKTLHDFVEQRIRPVIEPLITAIREAIETVSKAADDFDPAAIVEPLKNAMLEISARLDSGDVAQGLKEVDSALKAALEAVTKLDLHGAADQAIARLGEVEKKLAALDPNTIPEPAQPMVKQAIDAITDVDFAQLVADPIAKGVASALEKGPAAVISSLEDALGELKERIERFRPSAAIGAQLDAPFEQLLATLRAFQPSQLIERVTAAIASVAERVRLLEPGQVIEPLVALHTELQQKLAPLRPSKLVEPVNQAIAAAIQRVFEASGVDDVFDGIDEVLRRLREVLELMEATRSSLESIASMLADPGDVEGALDDLVESTLGRLDPVQLSELGGAFAARAASVQAIDRNQLADAIASALDAAGRKTPDALRSRESVRLREIVFAFPLEQLAASRNTPSQRRFEDLIRRLRAAAGVLEKSVEPWSDAAPKFAALASEIQPRLETYARLSQVDGHPVFAEFAQAPADIPALKEAVRQAMRDGLRLPFTALFGLFKALAPHAAGAASGLAHVVGALRAKLDEISGEQGVGGLAHSIEKAADLLKHIDLAPLTTPLDEIFARIESALAALDPAPLGVALNAAAQEIAGLLDLSTLVEAHSLDALNATYAQAQAKLARLSPSAMISATLDPVFDDLLKSVTPVIELPAHLKALVQETGGRLSGDVVAELGRVEVAFDEMLHAIPFGGEGGSVSVEVHVSATASVS